MGNGLNIFYIMGFVVGHLFHFMTTLHPVGELEPILLMTYDLMPRGALGVWQVTKNSSFWEAPAQLEKLMPAAADTATFTAEGGPAEEVRRGKAEGWAGGRLSGAAWSRPWTCLSGLSDER